MTENKKDSPTQPAFFREQNSFQKSTQPCFSIWQQNELKKNSLHSPGRELQVDREKLLWRVGGF